MPNQPGYGFLEKQPYESLDYEEFYGPDAYLVAWCSLQTEEQRVKQLSHSSMLEKFVHALTRKWQPQEKHIELRLSLPRWRVFTDRFHFKSR